MKKHIKPLALLCFSTGIALAQPTKSDSVEIEINNNRISVEAFDLEALSGLDLNTMIREIVEKTQKIQAQQNELLASIDKQLANGEITEEEAEEMRESIMERTEESMEVIGELMENWGEAYGERWEAWAEEFEGQMEKWEQSMEERAAHNSANGAIPPIPPLPPLPPVPSPGSHGGYAPHPEMIAPQDSGKKNQKIIISEEGIIIKKGNGDDAPFALKFEKDKESGKNENKKIERTETYLDLHLGFNQILEDGMYVIVDEPGELNFWKSTQFEFGMGGKTRLGSPYSKIYLKWGGEFSWHDFTLIGNNILDKNYSSGASKAVFIQDNSRGYSKSKYEIVYFNIPLMLQLDLSEVGEMDEAFTLGIGGYAGVRIKSQRELEYNDIDGSEIEEDVKNDFATNRFRYGVMAQAGWKAFKITAKYDLNSYFRNNRGPLNSEGVDGNYQLAALSLGFTL